MGMSDLEYARLTGDIPRVLVSRSKRANIAERNDDIATNAINGKWRKGDGELVRFEDINDDWAANIVRYCERHGWDCPLQIREKVTK